MASLKYSLDIGICIKYLIIWDLEYVIKLVPIVKVLLKGGSFELYHYCLLVFFHVRFVRNSDRPDDYIAFLEYGKVIFTSLPGGLQAEQPYHLR